MSTGNIPARTPSHIVWQAEDRANQRLGELLETGAVHVCGNCRTPMGRSKLRCRNEAS